MKYRLKSIQETDSTNEEVKKAAIAGEAEGFVVQSVIQTAGKGRSGRSWSSPEGNLYVSLLLRPNCVVADAGFHTFITALAVYDAVREFLPNAKTEIKWPNDVLVEDKKISGILLESSPSENGLVEWLVIGVGINVRHYPSASNHPATSLAEVGGRDIDVGLALESFLKRFAYWYGVLSEKGFAEIRAEWLKRARKGHITARLPQETVSGEFEDLDNSGQLILKLADGSKRSIAAGDVFFGESR